MKAKELMTTDLVTCAPETSVAEAARLMWEGDCHKPMKSDAVIDTLLGDRRVSSSGPPRDLGLSAREGRTT